jgi:hypothetical protein
METLIDDRKIKDFLKQAIIEAIEEKKEIVHDLLVEVMEDIAMVRAIQDGEDSGQASRDDIFQILKGKEGSA